jgi:mannose-6-phosphate isomerase-like protein (cupin superfamily)
MWISFGLGKCSQVQRLEIRWPSGGVEVHEDLAADRVWRVVEGRGIAAEGGEQE